MAIPAFKLLLIDAASRAIVYADGPSGKILAEQPLPPNLSPVDLTLGAKPGCAYVTLAGDNGRGAIYPLCISPLRFDQAPLPTPHPAQVSFTPDSRIAYLADPTGALYALDLESTTVMPLPGQELPPGSCVGLAADDQYLYAVWESPSGGLVTAFNRSGTPAWRAEVGGIPTSLTYAAPGLVLVPFTASAFSGEGVAIISPLKTTVIPLQCSRCAATSRAYPSHIALAPGGQTAYVVLEDHGAIGFFSLSDRTIAETFPVARSLSRLTVLVGGNLAVATSNMFADISLIDLANRKLLSFTNTDREFLNSLAIIY